MKKGKRWILILVGCFLFLSGFGMKKSVQIQGNSNIPLINLEEAIRPASRGTDGNDEDEASDEESAAKEEEEKDASSGDREQDTVDKNQTFLIEVAGKKITLNGTELKSVKELKAVLSENYKKGDTVKIFDQYAESETYKQVLEMLSEIVEDPKGDFDQKWW